MNPDTGTSQKQFEETQIDYHIMLIKKRKRIEYYKKYKEELEQETTKQGFGLTDKDISHRNMLRALDREIRIEEAEYAEWTDELIANSGKHI